MCRLLLSVADGSVSSAVTNCYQPRHFLVAAGNQVLFVCFAALVTTVSLRAAQAQPAHRRLALWIGVGLNLALLIFFKSKRVADSGNTLQGTVRASPAMSAIYNFRFMYSTVSA